MSAFHSKPKYIAFDCEGTGLPSDKNTRITCTVTIASPPLLTNPNEIIYWHSNYKHTMSEQDVMLLIDYLYDAFSNNNYKIVSYNGTGYDFRMLARHITTEAYLIKIQNLAIGNTDLFLDFACEFGYYTSMQSFAEGCKLKGKTGHGKDAIEGWLSNNRTRQDNVLEYCKNDVQCLCRIFDFACEHSRLYRKTNAGKVQLWMSREPHIRSAGQCMLQYNETPPKVIWMKKPPDISNIWEWITF